MANNMDDYWSNEIKSYDGQWDTGPDDKHDLWKWREFIKMGRIINAEIKCKVRMGGVPTMATVKCALGKRGRPSHEWNDGKKDRIYCLGRVDPMTDDPLPECLDCPDFVNKAQDDLEAFYGRADNG